MAANRFRTKETPSRAWHVAPVLGVIAGVAATAYLLLPLRPTHGGWTREFTSSASLAASIVNAKVVAIGPSGAELARDGARPISVICEPPSRNEAGHSLIVMRASRVEAAEGRPAPATVRLLWQTEPRLDFHYDDQLVELGVDPTEIVFSLPCEESRLHRLGVQFPALNRVRVSSIGLPDVSAGDKLGIAWRQLIAPEPIRNYSINFLRGPAPLGRSLNAYLAAIFVAVGGGVALVAAVRRRRVNLHILAGIALAIWFLGDARSTWNLASEIRQEAAGLNDLSRLQQIASMYGTDVAWAYQCVSGLTPSGSTYSVISDDDFYPAHRLDYLLAPRRIRREAYESADYVVVIRASGKRYAEITDRFQFGKGPTVAVERLAMYSPDVFVLRRTGP